MLFSLALVSDKNMARRVISDEQLFHINIVAKEAICVLCNKKLTDLRRFSYHRHYKTLHKDFSRQHGLLYADEEESAAGPSRKIPKIEVRINRKTYMSAMVELVTVNGLPLNVFKYSAFQSIARPIEDELKLTKHLDPHSIREVLSKVAEQIHVMIMSEIADKLICLKMDAATRMDREFLGVNIQFVEKKHIKIRTLKIIELHERHTAANLTEEVLKILAPYGIDIRRLLTVTTDNAQNMRATINRLKMAQELELNSFGFCDDANNDEDEDEEEENDVDDQDNVDQTMELIEPILQGVRCVEHTLQLAVGDTFKETRMKEKIMQIRNNVKTLRKLPYRKLFSISKRNKPKLDCPTRWNSTYMMVQSIFKEKDFIMALGDGEDQIIDDDMWDFLKNFYQAFKPVAEATLQLQNPQITFGDFFLIWETCSFNVRRADNEISRVIAEKMDKRCVFLMTNKSFLAALFVDQRINFRNSPFFTDEQRLVAMLNTFHVHLCLRVILFLVSGVHQTNLGHHSSYHWSLSSWK